LISLLRLLGKLSKLFLNGLQGLFKLVDLRSDPLLLSRSWISVSICDSCCCKTVASSDVTEVDELDEVDEVEVPDEFLALVNALDLFADKLVQCNN
jgi:hypothetical protein